jgi:transmembrane sensor
MSKISHIPDSLLVKYMLHETTPDEKLQVEQWLAADEANEKEFQHFVFIWQENEKLQQKSTIDEDIAWQRFKQLAYEKSAAKAKTIPLRARSFGWMRIAAMLVLMIGVSAIMYYTIYGDRTLTLTAENTVITQTLPDGTMVTLNKNARLRYPKSFSSNTREIRLEGEAFFDVSHDKSKPFIIHANEADIRVVGTSFNVKTASDVTEVIVETGIVRVSKQQQQVILNRKEKATVKKDVAEPIKEHEFDELYNYYRTKEFVCHGTALRKLVAVLNEAYNVHIIIENEDKNELPITTTFRNDSLDNILTVISSTFNLTVEKRDNIIILK